MVIIKFFLIAILTVPLASLAQSPEQQRTSPLAIAAMRYKDAYVKITYCRPQKLGREIFGNLVPYGQVWRTGANEATTFETNKTITIEGKKLSPGKYSVWTIPDTTTWTVIFNGESGQWGVNHKGEANRNPELDVLSIPVHAVKQKNVFEQFTIAFEEMGEDVEMVLLWDNTVVAIPFSY